MSDTEGFQYYCDLSVKLFKSLTIFEYSLDKNHWLLFVPDCPGFPIVVDERIHSILRRFEGGATVSDIIVDICASGAPHYNLDQALSTIGMLEEKGFLRNEPNALPYPAPEVKVGSSPEFFEVWLHINDDCNLSCPYCFVTKKSHSSMSSKVLGQTAHAIASTAKINKIKRVNVKFAGGEPTLVMHQVENFRQKLQEELHGTGIKLHIALISNGTAINERVISFLRQPDTSISISLDGYGEIHDTFRKFKNTGLGSWDIISRNLSSLRDNSVTPQILATISRETSKGLPDLIKWAYSNDYMVRISIVRDASLDFGSYGAIIEAFERVFVELEDPSVFIDPRSSLRICELRFDYPACGVPCGIGTNHIVIKSNGNIVNCPMVIDEPGAEPSEDLLSTCRSCFDYSPSRRRSYSSEDDCLNCIWFPVCAGGCPAMNQKLQGYPFTKSALCDFYKYVIPRYLVFFGRKLLQCDNQKGAPTISTSNIL